MGGGVGSPPPIGLSPAGGVGSTGAVPEVPGVMPVDAGACEDPGEVGAVGSWEAVVELTAVVMACAAMGRSGSGTDGTLGKAGGLTLWCCSFGWWACAPCPAGALAGVLGDLAALVLGDAGVPEGPLPAMSPARVGFKGCVGALGTLGVNGALGDSVSDGALAARGISGSWWGSTCGPSPVMPRCTAACSTVGAVDDAAARIYVGVVEAPGSPAKLCPIASKSIISLVAMAAMSLRYLSVRAVDEGVTGVPVSSELSASRIS